MLVRSPGTNIELQRGAELLTMLHVSLFLFFAGVLIYFFNISRGTFYVSLGVILYFALPYAGATVVNLLQPTELFYTPFSSILFFTFLCFEEGFPGFGMIFEYRKLLVKRIVSKPSAELDNGILSQMLLHLDDDQALERFFEASHPWLLRIETCPKTSRFSGHDQVATILGWFLGPHLFIPIGPRIE
jgi:hypothetical protein